MIKRTLHPEVRILDEKLGLASYIASDESIDSYKEVIRADGWRFDHFQKNSPFVDSHNYGTIARLVGKVVDFQVKGRELHETVQWAIDVPENDLARIGWSMTRGGYLKAVSVGFFPEKLVSVYDRDLGPYRDELKALHYEEGKSAPRVVYQQQQQIELSACIVGANPNALAKSYKLGLLTDADLDLLSSQQREYASSAVDAAVAEEARQRTRLSFLDSFARALKAL